MAWLRLQARWGNWFLIAALLLSALNLATSVRLSDGASAWVEVCSLQGTKWVQADPLGDAPPTTGQGHGSHCPWCLGHATGLALPAPDRAWAVAQGLWQERPLARDEAPTLPQPWRHAQPRAPPQAS